MNVDLSIIENKVNSEYEVRLVIDDLQPQTWYFDNEADAQICFDVINRFFDVIEDQLSEGNL